MIHLRNDDHLLRRQNHQMELTAVEKTFHIGMFVLLRQGEGKVYESASHPEVS